VRRLGRGVRIEVSDGDGYLPVVGAARPEDLLSNRSMTGRGLALVAATADRWGAEPVSAGGKMVWAELGTGRRLPATAPPPSFPPVPPARPLDDGQRKAGMTTASAVTGGGRRVHLIGVPVHLLVESNRQFADLQRELQVMALDHSGPEASDHMVVGNHELAAQMDRWSDTDRILAEQALARGQDRLDFDLTVSEDVASGIDRFASWFRKLSASLMRRDLLTLPPSPEVDAYRTWYRDEIVAQLNGAAPRPCPLD
jgi:hypothetical protein